ncbi:hypothetical protein BASA62_000332 [Batrachochytrium salamandrivorans]|nr:hypothetical protein BASA62_000332 [Batrachochytrium salamandrivorans]
MPKHSCPFSSSDSNYSNSLTNATQQQQQHNMPSPSGLDQRPAVSATAVAVFCLTTFPPVEPGLLVMVAPPACPGGPSRKDVNSKTPSFNGSPVASDTSHRFVTGAPTRDHWKSDAYAPECSLCGQRFSLLIRRHHCRRCGDIFCSSCCDVTVRLDQNAAFHPAGLICPLDDSLDNDDEANSIPINLKENVKDVAETPMLSVPTDWAWSTF